MEISYNRPPSQVMGGRTRCVKARPRPWVEQANGPTIFLSINSFMCHHAFQPLVRKFMRNVHISSMTWYREHAEATIPPRASRHLYTALSRPPPLSSPAHTRFTCPRSRSWSRLRPHFYPLPSVEPRNRPSTVPKAPDRSRARTSTWKSGEQGHEHHTALVAINSSC